MQLNGDNIYWDLDGVLRNLALAVHGKHPENWNNTIFGVDICDYIDKHLSVLEKAPETEYTYFAKQFHPLKIISSQPRGWRVNTDKWVWKHLPAACPYITYVENAYDKLEFLKYGDILIEDYPFYEDYSNIILIDRPYNRNVENAERVSSENKLRMAIERRMGWKAQL